MANTHTEPQREEISIKLIDNPTFLKWVYELLIDIRHYPDRDQGITKAYLKSESRRLLSFMVKSSVNTQQININRSND